MGKKHWNEPWNGGAEIRPGIPRLRGLTESLPVAAMVADVHRILVRGGLFLYPADTRPKLADGKLRLLYECAPMGWLVERAGGTAYGAAGPVLEVVPRSLHQRSPIALGSRRVLDDAWRDFLSADAS